MIIPQTASALLRALSAAPDAPEPSPWLDYQATPPDELYELPSAPPTPLNELSAQQMAAIIEGLAEVRAKALVASSMAKIAAEAQRVQRIVAAKGPIRECAPMGRGRWDWRGWLRW